MATEALLKCRSRPTQDPELQQSFGRLSDASDSICKGCSRLELWRRFQIHPKRTIRQNAPFEGGVKMEATRCPRKKLAMHLFPAACAIVLMLGAVTAQAAPCSVPSLSYPTIQSAVNDPGCSPINVAPGAYVENVTIPRPLVLNGAQAGNPVAGRTFGSPLVESTVTGTITIQAANVTVDGFSHTNPGQSTGILIKTAGNGALIINNIIDVIGGVSFAGNTQGIYLENGPDNVRVAGNKISRVEGIASSNGGIFIGDSAASNPSLNILIDGNSISDIHSVNRGAYAIHVNNGASTAPTATGYTTGTILNNSITNLVGGGWAHAIGLEGDTPGLLVLGNSISNLVVPGIDGVAVWFEDNPSFSTGGVNYNNLDVTIAYFGIAVHPAIVGLSPVDGRCNWWGDPNGPGPIGPGLGAKVGPRVNFTPWLTAPAPGGACLGGVPSTPGKVTGGGQIPGEDPLFSPVGVLLSLPALIPSLSDPNQRATFGFNVRCCAPNGNLEYNDHSSDVRIKAQSVDALVISSPGTSCPATPGSRHAEFTGMADVIRSTGTMTEPYTVVVDDCGEPGTADTFGIRTTTYLNGPSTLVGGNIQIH
jgi:hypothetical protein